MTAQITELILEQDGHEIVQAALGNILAVEIANQQALAVAQSLDPESWRADVYSSRMLPFDDKLSGDDTSPTINVWFQSGNYSKKGSTIRNERGEGSWMVDVYARGKSQRTAEGHLPGDEAAKLQLDRWLGIVRRILMSAQYAYLGSDRGANQWCFGRWVESVTTFQPELETRQAITVLGGRLSLNVDFKVDSPQYLGVIFELLSASVFREEDGRLLAKMTSAKNGEFQAGFSETFD